MPDSIDHIGQLKPDPKNARKHPERNISQLVRALNEVGAARSIVIDEEDTILAGNGVVEAAATAGIERVRVIEASGNEIIAVRRTGLTAEQKTKLALWDNRVAELAEWDADVLKELSAEVDLSDLFFGDELDALLKSVSEPESAILPGADPDQLPEQVETRCKPGDLWSLGRHRLLVGDCTNPEHIERLMDGEQAACLWTDPPYGVGIVGGNRRLSPKERKVARPQSASIANDSPDGLLDLLIGAFSLAPLEPGSPWYVARPPGALQRFFVEALWQVGWKLHEDLQWIKGNLVLGHSDYHLRHETIMYGWTPGPGRSGRGHHEGSRWYGSDGEDSVFEFPLTPSPDHPSMKPVGLVAAMLTNSLPSGGLVYDAFMGSGTTLIAAEETGRRCYGLEIMPVYADVILSRWETLTGQTAHLLPLT